MNEKVKPLLIKRWTEKECSLQKLHVLGIQGHSYLYYVFFTNNNLMYSVFRDTRIYIMSFLPTTTSCTRYSGTLVFILCLFYQQQPHVLGIQGHSYLYYVSFTNNNFMCSVFRDTPIDIMSLLPTTTSCARYSGTLLVMLGFFYQQQLHVLGIQ